jgi:hypothetical protein
MLNVEPRHYRVQYEGCFELDGASTEFEFPAGGAITGHLKQLSIVGCVEKLRGW